MHGICLALLQQWQLQPCTAVRGTCGPVARVDQLHVYRQRQLQHSQPLWVQRQHPSRSWSKLQPGNLLCLLIVPLALWVAQAPCRAPCWRRMSCTCLLFQHCNLELQLGTVSSLHVHLIPGLLCFTCMTDQDTSGDPSSGCFATCYCTATAVGCALAFTHAVSTHAHCHLDVWWQ